jgi:hypothetical protein
MNICKDHCKLSKCPILNKDQCPVVILLKRAEEAMRASSEIYKVKINPISLN